ncbi:hypothetical protein ACQJBY_057572 [Aegilops geniculata]
MYMQAMELVRMGHASVQAYERSVALVKHYAEKMKPFADIRDGLGLEDRIAENGVVVNQYQAEADQLVVDMATNGAMDNDDINSMNESGNMLAGLLPPAKRKEMGRPTTSREKDPYEGLSKRTRFCTICRREGHKRTTCPDHGDVPKQPQRPGRCKLVVLKGTAGTNATKRLS